MAQNASNAGSCDGHPANVLPWAVNPDPWTGIRGRARIRSQLHSAYLSGKYTDLKISSRNRTFDVHKLIISVQSKVFAAMIDSKFKEGLEAHIHLPDDDPDVIELVINFLYRGRYDPSATMISYSDDESDTSNIGEDPLSGKVHAVVYVFADKYDIPNLLKLAAEHYYDSFPPWRYKHQSTPVEGYIAFLETIPIVYSTPALADSGDLRDLASRMMYLFSKEIERLAAESEELRSLREQVLRETTDFACDLALLLIKAPTPACEECTKLPTPPTDYKVGQMRCTGCHKNTAFCRINGSPVSHYRW